MGLAARVAGGLRALLRGARDERELDAELRDFLDSAIEQKTRDGMSSEDAARAARLELGSADAVKDRVRDVGWESVAEGCWRDVRHAARMLRRSPGFTAAAVVTFGLGIGATTAIFTFVNGVVLRPLPFTDSARLVVVEPDVRESALFRITTVTPGDFLDWQRLNDVFAHMAGFTGAPLSLTGGAEPERVRGAAVTPGFFEALGVVPTVGRAFVAADANDGAAPVAVISSSLWRRRFASDPAVVGGRVQLDGNPVTVVGVMPDGFTFPQDLLPGGGERPLEIWTPVVLVPGDRANAFLQVIGRLKPGVTIGQARIAMGALAARVAERAAQRNRGAAAVRIASLHEHVVREVRPLLLVFLGAVGFLLLIACSNVASLLVARGAARQREVALRGAIGASRARLVRQFLTESLLLGALGGLAGLLLAGPAVDVLIGMMPPGSLPRLGETGIDGQVLAFTTAVSLLAGAGSALAPALRWSAADIGAAIKVAGPNQTPRTRFLHTLVAGEVALAFVLLAGAGLMINSFWRLTSVDPGFQPDRILTASVTLPEGGYETSAAMRAFSTGVLERLRAAPGIARAAAVNWLPLGGMLIRGDFTVEGIGQLPDGLVVSKPAVSPEYFRAMGIPLLRGRPFSERDTEDAPGVAIVTDRLARQLWPGADPIGKRLELGFGPPESQPWLTVVGIVGDVKQTALAEEPLAAIYVPLLQAPRPFLLRDQTFVVRTAAGDPARVLPLVRDAIRGVDPNLPFDRVQTMSGLLNDSVAEPRFRAAVLAAFAGAAIALVATGILGVLAYLVTLRTREIGVRMALGAPRAGVLRLVVWQALRIAAAGLCVGAIAALALTRLLTAYLFDVRPTDPATFVAAALVLLLAVVVAAWFPARRAATVDPLVALRSE